MLTTDLSLGPRATCPASWRGAHRLANCDRLLCRSPSIFSRP
jgi:hypothetical protein